MAGICRDGGLLRVKHGKEEPEISIVVPVYNAKKYLHDCLESLLTQSFENIEVICVDDGSRDISGRICDDYALKDRRIKVIHQENQGAGAARNTGLTEAKGVYVAFLDADDMYRPNALAKAYAYAVTYTSDIVIFDAEFTDQNGTFLQKETINTAPLLKRETFSAKEIPDYLYQVTGCEPWNKLFRREVIIRKGIRFQTLRTANDLYFTSFAMACVERISVLPESLVIHRIRHSGNLQTLKKDTPLDFLIALEKVKTDLCRYTLWESLERSFVNLALENCVYNYQTLHRKGRRQLIQQKKQICDILELQERDESYYYNRNSYRQICQWLITGKEQKKMWWIIRFKEFLKKFLPPPIHAFNRELSSLRQFVQEQTSGLRSTQHKEIEHVLEILDQQQKLISEQQQQLDSIAEKIQESFAFQQILGQRLIGLEKQLLELDKLDMLEKKLVELDKLDNLEKGLLKLDKFAVLEKSLQTSIANGNTQVTKMLNDEKVFAEQNSSNVSKLLSEHSKITARLSGIGGQLDRIELGAKRATPQPRLSYLVLNILDHCNLRCKGCDHFACIADERFVSVDNIKKDVVRMSELLHGAVTRIGIMGGEPLLHPNLLEILAATRTAFPNTIIQLVTNGLLLLKMSDDFWKCCQQNNIIIANTKYPINQDYEKMQRTAAEHDVRFEFYGGSGKVQKTSYKNPLDLEGRQDPVYSFWRCYHANNCCFLEEGKLYTCTMAPTIHIFNKRYNTNLKLETGDSLDIYAVKNTDEVFRFLATPKPFCRYCMVSKRTTGLPWDQSKQEMSEWLPD